MSSFSFPELTLTDDLIPHGAWHTGGQVSLWMGGMKVRVEAVLDGVGVVGLALTTPATLSPRPWAPGG